MESKKENGQLSKNKNLSNSTTAMEIDGQKYLETLKEGKFVIKV
jgi:hypothetical protein